MSNAFLSLPVPVGNGVGAAVDVTALSGLKTIVIGGTFGAIVAVETSSDGGTTFGPIPGVTTQSPIVETVPLSATHMRVRLSNHLSGTPVVFVGSAVTDTNAVTMNVPSTDGSGTAADIGTFGSLLTLVVSGSFGGSINIEVSDDNINWSPLVFFNNPGTVTVQCFASKMRVTRAGVGFDPGLPVIAVSASETASGGGGGGGGSGGVSMTWVYAPDNPLGRHENVYTDFNELMADYVLRDKTLGTGSICFNPNFLVGNFPVMLLPAKTGGGKYDVTDTQFTGIVGSTFFALQFALGCQFTWDTYGTVDRDTPFLLINGFRGFLSNFGPTGSIPFEIPDGAGIGFAGLYEPTFGFGEPLYQLAATGFGVLSCTAGYHNGFQGDGVIDLNGAFLRAENLNMDDGAITDSSGGLGQWFIQERSFESMVGFEGILQWSFPGLTAGANLVGHQLVPRSRYRMNYPLNPGPGGDLFNPPVVHTDAVGAPYAAQYNEFIYCDTTAADVGVVLPTAIWPQGEKITIKIKTGANDVVVTPPAAQTIDDGASHTLAGGTKGSVSFVTDGYGNWAVVDKAPDNT